MKRKTTNKSEGVAFKVGICKAYDQVYQGYLKCIVLKLGFAPEWVDLIMECVSSINYYNLIMECVSSIKYSIPLNDQCVVLIHPL